MLWFDDLAISQVQRTNGEAGESYIAAEYD